MIDVKLENGTLSGSVGLFTMLPLLLLFVALAICIRMLRHGALTLPARLDRLPRDFGLSDLSPAIFWTAAILWGALVLTLTAGLFGLILETLFHATVRSSDPEAWDFRFLLAQVVALTGVLGALVALPFTLVRIALTRAQNATAAEVMITERLSKAVELLGNTDTAVRMGAIYLLDRLMVDSAVDRVMVLETLNAYLKYRRAIDAAESAEQVMDMDIDVQAALDVILKWTDRSR